MKRNYDLFKEMDNSQKRNKEDLFKDVLLKVIGDYYLLDYGYVTAKNRKREVVFARQIAMHLLLKNTKWTLGKIGENFNRDHSTVLHGDRVVKDLMSYHKRIKNDVAKIEKLTNQELSIILKKEKVDSRFHYIDLNNYTSVRVTNKKGLIFSGYTEAEIFEILTTLKIGDVDTFNHKKTGSYILERIKNDGNTRNTTSIDS
jgi:hypothetical protein